MEVSGEVAARANASKTAQPEVGGGVAAIADGSIDNVLHEITELIGIDVTGAAGVRGVTVELVDEEVEARVKARFSSFDASLGLIAPAVEFSFDDRAGRAGTDSEGDRGKGESSLHGLLVS